MKRIILILFLLIVSSITLSAPKPLTYPELDSLVWNKYSQVTQLEYDGYSQVSNFSITDFTWHLSPTIHDLYGFSNNSAYFVKSPDYGIESSTIYLTDKEKVLQYWRKMEGQPHADITKYENHFPPQVSSSNDYLPYFLFSKVSSFNLTEPEISYDTTDSGKELIILKGKTKSGYNRTVYIDPPNYIITKEIYDLGKLRLENYYENYEFINGIYFPTKARKIDVTVSGMTITNISAEYKNIRINHFQNYDLLSNKLEEGAWICDRRYGKEEEKGSFYYEYSTTLTEASVAQLAAVRDNHNIMHKKNEIPPKKSYWFYGGILFLIGGVFLASSRLLRKK